MIISVVFGEPYLGSVGCHCLASAFAAGRGMPVLPDVQGDRKHLNFSTVTKIKEMLLLSLFFFLLLIWELSASCSMRPKRERQERKTRGKFTLFLHFIALYEAWPGFIKFTDLVFP